MRVAVCGAGRWGVNLVREFSARCEVVVVDPDPTKAEIQELHEVLAGVDAVVVATPPSSHFELCWDSLSAGKHVFCEKPLTLDYAQASELVALAQDRGVVLFAGQITLYQPETRVLRGLLPRVGTVVAAWSERHSVSEPRPEGVLWDLAPHDLALLTDLFGSPSDLSVAFCEDGALVSATFGEVPCAVEVHCSRPSKLRSLVVGGTKATAIVTPGFVELWQYGRMVECVPVAGDALGLEVDRFLSLCRGGEWLSELELAVSTVRTLEALHALR